MERTLLPCLAIREVTLRIGNARVKVRERVWRSLAVNGREGEEGEEYVGEHCRLFEMT